MRSLAILIFAVILTLPESEQKECTCGVSSHRQVRSTNSYKERPYHFPWTAFIAHFNEGKREKCTGALIHESYIMTAAHCTPQNEDASTILVSFNQECGTKFLPKEQLMPIAQIFRNPGYQNCSGKGTCTMAGGDIAILKLSTPQPDIMPICLGVSGSYDHLIVSGWGREDDEYQVNCQRVAELQAVSDEACHKYNPNSPIDRVMCAGSRESSNICVGDSGSALMTYKDDRYHAIGVSSFGKDNCATTKEPSVFERVSAHISWIRQVTGNAVCINRDSGVAQTTSPPPKRRPDQSKRPIPTQQQQQQNLGSGHGSVPQPADTQFSSDCEL